MIKRTVTWKDGRSSSYDFYHRTLLELEQLNTQMFANPQNTIAKIEMFNEGGELLWTSAPEPKEETDLTYSSGLAKFHRDVRENFLIDGYSLPRLTDEEIKSFPVVEWPKNPVFVKPQHAMFRTRFVAAEQIWPRSEKNRGQFVAVGYCILNDGSVREVSTRTSIVVHVDIELGYFETLNSHYWMR